MICLIIQCVCVPCSCAVTDFSCQFLMWNCLSDRARCAKTPTHKQLTTGKLNLVSLYRFLLVLCFFVALATTNWPLNCVYVLPINPESEFSWFSYTVVRVLFHPCTLALNLTITYIRIVVSASIQLKIQSGKSASYQCYQSERCTMALANSNKRV